MKVEVSEQKYLCVRKISHMININSARTNKCNEGSTDKHRVHSGPFPGSAVPPEMSDPKLTRFLSVRSGPHRLYHFGTDTAGVQREVLVFAVRLHPLSKCYHSICGIHGELIELCTCIRENM